MNDESGTGLLEVGGVGIDEGRVRESAPALLLWAERRIERQRRVARMSIVGVLAGGLILGGGAVAATIAGSNSGVPTGRFDAHWVIETSTGEVCDIWMGIEPDPTATERAQAQRDAEFAREYLESVEISSIDYRDGYEFFDPADTGTQGELEALGVSMAIQFAIGDLRRNGEPLMIEMFSPSHCGPGPAE
ncbi:hypothetical protein [Pseudolysinimonas sp.]|jgi:hypothetical protein|uniref:hypothetical protein n=1 Tax=Pseudolysinimonas sp. TaxID=2680009 RepID=UPI003782DB9A